MDITELAILKAISGGGAGTSGGTMVVHFESDSELKTVTADKTMEEVYNAMLSKSIIGVLTVGGSSIPLGSCIAHYADIAGYPAFMPIVHNDELTYLIDGTQGEGWRINASN